MAIPTADDAPESGFGSITRSPLAEGIGRAILRGEIAPGQRLVEIDLSDHFGAPRSAVRSALIELANEGLVERIHHRGARVRVASVAEAIEMTEARIGLEALCATRAARNATRADIGDLRRLGADLRVAVSSGDLTGCAEGNRLLHHRIYRLARHTVAGELAERLRGQSGVAHQFRLVRQPRRPADSLAEHLAIIDAIARRDAEAAGAAMATHLRSVMSALVAAVSTAQGDSAVATAQANPAVTTAQASTAVATAQASTAVATAQASTAVATDQASTAASTAQTDGSGATAHTSTSLSTTPHPAD